MREQAIAFAENFDGWLRRVMQKKFRSPIKEIRLARIQLSRALILADRFERVAQLLFEVGE
jgi:hypothetical protein